MSNKKLSLKTEVIFKFINYLSEMFFYAHVHQFSIINGHHDAKTKMMIYKVTKISKTIKSVRVFSKY